MANTNDSSNTPGGKPSPSPSPSPEAPETPSLVPITSTTKAGAAQLWAPEAAEIYLSGRTPALTRQMIAKLKSAANSSPSALSNTQGSWNIPLMLMWSAACSGHATPAQALRYFGAFLDCQVHGKGSGHLRFLTGSETLSADYWALQWGAVCGMEVWVRRGIQKGLFSELDKLVISVLLLCRRYHAICVRTALLLSHAQDGKLYVSPVSERSNEWSDGNVSPMVEVFTGQSSKRNPLHPKRYTRSIDWPVRLARQCQRPSTQEISSAPLPRLWAPVHRAEWADGTTCTYKPSMQNHNTLSYLAEVWRPDGTRELLYPWPSGRAFGILGLSEVSRMADGNLKASWKWQGKGSGEDWTEGETIISLPKTAPTKSFILGPDGYREGVW